MAETLPPIQRASLPSRWEPSEVEARLYQQWVDAGYFTGDPSSGKPPFCIVIPPPNVTGVRHLWHAMDHTLIDVLTRRRRMQGYDALWLSGADLLYHFTWDELSEAKLGNPKFHRAGAGRCGGRHPGPPGRGDRGHRADQGGAAGGLGGWR